MSIQQYGGILPTPVLEALSEEGADFSGKAEGSYQILEDSNCVVVKKVNTVARSEGRGISDTAAEPLDKTLDLPISMIVHDLHAEVDKVISVVRERFITGNNIDIASFRVASVQVSCLENLKQLVASQAIQQEIDYVEERINALKCGTPASLVLEKALEEGDLNLAIWAIEKGAEPKTLDSPRNSKFTPEALSWLKKRAQKLEYTPENLNHYALDVGFGYKTTNLKVMEAQLQEASKELNAEVKIPPVLGISNFEMWEVLKTGIPDLEQDWAAFLASFDPSEKDKFLQASSSDKAKESPPQISRNGEEILSRIEEKIAKYLANTKTYSSPMLQEWLDTIKPTHVIVRSTGKEDSDVAANAGGNESVPFVEPTEHEISRAIGIVVGSYFGRKSIVQRLQAGDQSVFTEKPFLPVLVQEMVCEPFESGKGSGPLDIPRSGVLFTKQPGLANDVVVINAALGSNEGVVSSQVVVDTFSVHPEGVYSITRDKDVRFVQQKSSATGRYTVGPIANSDKELRKAPSLSAELATELAKLATNFGTLYGKGSVKAMDMEFTIMFKRTEDLRGSSTIRPVIYPLQIRPLLAKQDLNPSFLKLDEVKKLSSEHQVRAATLLSGDCGTKVIDNPAEQVLFADDLPQALQKYQHMENAGNIRLIVTRKTAPLTSHEAVTFSQTGIPILTLSNAESYLQARKLMGKATRDVPCFADPQRSLIIYGEGKAEDTLVGQGLVSYPSPREYSLADAPRDFSCLGKKTPAERGEAAADLMKRSAEMFNDRFRGRKQQLDALRKLSHMELLDKMAMGTEEEALDAAIYLVCNQLSRLALANNAARIKQQIVDGDPGLADDTLVDLVRVYEEAFHLLTTDIQAAIKKYPPNDINRLFYLKPLESLLLQEGSIDIMNSHSILSAMSMRSNYPALGEIHQRYKLDMGRSNTWLLVMGKMGYRKDTRENWYTFVSGLSEGNKRKLIEKLKMLQDLGVDELYINVFFQRYWNSEAADVQKVYTHFMQTIENESGNLAWLQERQVTLKTLEGQVGNWGVPSYAEKHMPELRTKLDDLGLINKDLTPSKEFAERYRRATPFARLALLSYAHRVITCYDETVKSVSGSTMFETKAEKAKFFAEVLKPYHAMMETMMELPDRAKQKEMMKDDMGEAPVSFADYKKGIREGRVFLHQDLFEQYDTVTKYEDWHTGQTPTMIPGQFYEAEEFFKSRGFEEICLNAAAGGLREAEAQKHFEVREYFNVDAFVPGGKIDRVNKVYWPSRLEEYFTSFHQTMESIVRHELTENGVKADLLPEELKTTCEGFEQELGVESPTSITKQGENIVVMYDVPLRQHAAKVRFVMNAHKLDTPIAMEVKIFGGDEADRFKRTAVLASLIAHLIPDVSFQNHIPPQINYQGTDGVSFTLEFPRKYLQMPQLMERLGVIIKDNTMVDDPAKLKANEMAAVTEQSLPALYEQFVVRGGKRPGYEGKEIEQFSAYLGLKDLDDWEKVPEQFFADALYLNLYLLDQFAKGKNYAMVEKIIRGSREGMQQYGLRDYDGTGITPKSELYSSAFASPQTSSLKTGITACLDRLIAEIKDDRASISEEIEKLRQEIEEDSETLLTLQKPQEEKALSQKPALGEAEIEERIRVAKEKVEALQAQDLTLEGQQGRLEKLL